MTDRLFPMQVNHFLICLYSSPILTWKLCYMMIQRQNHGYIRMSIKDMQFPMKQSPLMVLSISCRACFRSYRQDQMEVTRLSLGLLKRWIKLAHYLLISRRILARWNVSQGMREAPVGKVQAKYQQTGSDQVRQWALWIRMGTLPSDFGSFPNAFRQVCSKYSPFSPRLTCLKVAGRSFYRAVMSALCANGQNLLYISVMESPFSIFRMI